MKTIVEEIRETKEQQLKAMVKSVDKKVTNIEKIRKKQFEK